MTKHEALVTIAQTIARHRCDDNPQLADLYAALYTAVKLIPASDEEQQAVITELKQRYGY